VYLSVAIAEAPYRKKHSLFTCIHVVVIVFLDLANHRFFGRFFISVGIKTTGDSDGTQVIN
jgi:hypothetical protein